MKLNPFYEIARDLDLINLSYGEPHFDCLRSRIDRLSRRRPELSPFLNLVLAKAPADKDLAHYVLRDICRHLFGFAIPTPGGLAAIVEKASTIVEIGAGTGYWAALLSGRGATVHAFDNFSWSLRPLYWDVSRGGAVSAGKVEADGLLLCWPPLDTSMALRALKSFRGEWCFYVGEGHGGCTADDRFHDMLETEWCLEEVAPSASWPGLHDSVRIYRRRSGVVDSPSMTARSSADRASAS